MIESMATVRVTKAELARAVLDKIQRVFGPVAVISSPHRTGRPITEILSEARRRNLTVPLDEDFGKDLEDIIASHQTDRVGGQQIS